LLSNTDVILNLLLSSGGLQLQSVSILLYSPTELYYVAVTYMQNGYKWKLNKEMPPRRSILVVCSSSNSKLLEKWFWKNVNIVLFEKNPKEFFYGLNWYVPTLFDWYTVKSKGFPRDTHAGLSCRRYLYINPAHMKSK